MTEAASTGDIRISCHVEMHGIKCWRIRVFTPGHKWEFLPGPHGYNTRAEAMTAAHEFCQDKVTALIKELTPKQRNAIIGGMASDIPSKQGEEEE